MHLFFRGGGKRNAPQIFNWNSVKQFPFDKPERERQKGSAHFRREIVFNASNNSKFKVQKVIIQLELIVLLRGWKKLTVRHQRNV